MCIYNKCDNILKSLSIEIKYKNNCKKRMNKVGNDR